MKLRLRLFVVTCIAAALLSLAPASAVAQQPTDQPKVQPAAGNVAIGADIGFYKPDEEYKVAFTPQAYVEFYLHDRWSIRAMLGWERPRSMTGGSSMDHIRGTANLIYNFEAGYWHPYISLGYGAYVAQNREVDDNWDTPRYTKWGPNIAAGIEYFWSPKITIKFEINVHMVHPIAELGDGPGGFAVTLGLKKYF